MRQIRSFLLIALLLGGAAPLAWGGACPGGRFVALPRAGGAAPMVLELSQPSDRLGVVSVLGHGCTRPPDVLRMRRRGRVTVVAARWQACEGMPGPVRLRARIAPQCDRLKGTLMLRNASSKTMRVTAALTCPLDAGRYTLAPAGPATLDISGLGAPALTLEPATIEIGAGDAACRHPVVVPYPGGFAPGLGCFGGFTFAFQQTGCGVGVLDSDGGSDLTVRETADTSDRAVCAVPQHATCPAFQDTSLRVDVTVGDGAPDACGGPGTANALLSIPIAVTVWLDQGGCPAPDGTFTPGVDNFIGRVDQVVNLTTAATATQFADLDGDGCAFAGASSASSAARTGSCLAVSGADFTLAASAPGSASYLADFVATLQTPFRLSAAAAASGATCPTPPPTPITGGTASLCSVPAGCGDGVVEGGEQCDGASDASCPGGCRGDCRCAVCMNDVAERGEVCDWVDDAACPGRCQADCTCEPAAP